MTPQPATESKADRVAPEVPGFDISLPAGLQLIPSKPQVTAEEPLHAGTREVRPVLQKGMAPAK